jgi:hypothetical protein
VFLRDLRGKGILVFLIDRTQTASIIEHSGFDSFEAATA